MEWHNNKELQNKWSTNLIISHMTTIFSMIYFLCLKRDFFSATRSVVALVGSLAIVAALMRGSSGTRGTGLATLPLSSFLAWNITACKCGIYEYDLAAFMLTGTHRPVFLLQRLE